MAGGKLTKDRQDSLASQTYINTIIEVIHEPLVILSANYFVMNANEGFYKAFRVHHGKNVGKSFFEIAGRLFDQPVIRQFLEKLTATNVILTDLEATLQKKNGPQKLMLINGKLVQTKGMEKPVILLVFEDKTLQREFKEQKAKEKNILEENARLQTMSRQKDDFISMASHELKTPITSIKAFAQILEKDFQEEGNTMAAGMLARMNVQIVKLTGLIGDLLDASRMDTGKLHYHFNFFDLNNLVTETIKEIQMATKTHHIKSELNELPEVYGDRDRLGQVLTNFLTNAIKYSPEADEILVTNVVGKRRVMVCVRDFGLGVPRSKHKKVFEKFFRVNEHQDKTYPGIGLGLYISSEIVKKHGGEIGVKSPRGKGSLFYFTIPLQPGVKHVT